MYNAPLVSVIIPCRNEARTMGECLDSVLGNGYPKDLMEVLVIDGMSTDGTREIVSRYSAAYPYITLMDNPRRIVPTALNLGIGRSRGEIIIRMDAHNTYAPDYIEKCVSSLLSLVADNVGGRWITVPGDESLRARCIALALSHPFGVGNAHFRTGSRKPRLVDTVPFGCYRKSVFEKVGMFNENLVRNQDIEFNLRLKRHGGRILLVPQIVSHYHARSTLRALGRNNFWNGFWVVYSSRFVSAAFSLRHLIPLIFVASMAAGTAGALLDARALLLSGMVMLAYTAANAAASAGISSRQGWRHMPWLMATFAVLHFSYGLGSIWGFARLAFPKSAEKAALPVST